MIGEVLGWAFCLAGLAHTLRPWLVKRPAPLPPPKSIYAQKPWLQLSPKYDELWFPSLRPTADRRSVSDYNDDLDDI